MIRIEGLGGWRGCGDGDRLLSPSPLAGVRLAACPIITDDISSNQTKAHPPSSLTVSSGITGTTTVLPSSSLTGTSVGTEEPSPSVPPTGAGRATSISAESGFGRGSGIGTGLFKMGELTGAGTPLAAVTPVVRLLVAVVAAPGIAHPTAKVKQPTNSAGTHRESGEAERIKGDLHESKKNHNSHWVRSKPVRPGSEGSKRHSYHRYRSLVPHGQCTEIPRGQPLTQSHRNR